MKHTTATAKTEKHTQPCSNYKHRFKLMSP